MLLHDISSQNDDNRRGASRIKVSLVLCVQPLNNDLEPVGRPFKALTRDVSENGLGFFFKTPFPIEFVRVGPTEYSSSQSVARVCYNGLADSNRAQYLVGIQFLGNSNGGSSMN